MHATNAEHNPGPDPDAPDADGKLGIGGSDAFEGVDSRKAVEEELDDLRHEIEHFQQEKERVRTMVGKVGGVPTFNTMLFNVFFAVAIVVCFGVSLAVPNEMVRLAMVEIAVALVSIKLLIMMYAQSKVNHLQLWILSSLEWRLNELMKAVRSGGARRTPPPAGSGGD